MKKNTKILFSFLLICLVLVGCGKSKTEKKSNTKNEDIKVGQSIEIKVDTNNDDDYWNWELSGDDNVTVSYTSNKNTCKDDQEYCGETEIYTLTAISAGKSTFKLNYNNQDNENNSILDATYEITVDKNLNIAENHFGSYFDQE